MVVSLHMLKNTNTIEIGSRIRLHYGIGCGEEFGTLIEIKDGRWGTQYNVRTENGEDHWTSQIHTSLNCETNPNRSPIGAFLA